MHRYLATVVFVCFCSMHYVKILPICTMLRHTMVAMMSGTGRGVQWLLWFCVYLVLNRAPTYSYIYINDLGQPSWVLCRRRVEPHCTARMGGHCTGRQGARARARLPVARCRGKWHGSGAAETGEGRRRRVLRRHGTGRRTCDSIFFFDRRSILFLNGY